MMIRLIALIALLSATPLIQSLSLSLPATQSRSEEDDDNDTPLPLIIWHGLGDKFDNEGLTSIGSLAEEVNPGTFTYIIKLDPDPSADRTATFFGNLTLQIEQVCAELAAHPILSTAPAVDALGFSQGGQFLRGYIERCNFPPVRSLVTFGSQHNGISEFQECEPTNWACRGVEGLLRSNTWSTFVQSRLVPAQYFRDPLQYDSYLLYSNFLADINNERPFKNSTYKTNLSKLEKFVMYMFEDDKTVIPKESGWFAEVNGTEVTELRKRDIYQEDWLGLKELDGRGGLEFKTTPGRHMSLTDKLLKNVFKSYYGPLAKTFEDSEESQKVMREDL